MVEKQVVEKTLKNTIRDRIEWGQICFTGKKVIHTETF